MNIMASHFHWKHVMPFFIFKEKSFNPSLTIFLRKKMFSSFVQVGDFGLSKIKRNTLVTGGVRGTLPWMAPELLNGSSSRVSEKVRYYNCCQACKSIKRNEKLT